MGADEKTVRKKIRRRVAGRNRQWAKYQETGAQGHLKVFRQHRLALQYLRRVLNRVVLRQDRPSDNFAYSEFNTKDGTPVPTASYPALDHLCQTYLEPLRARFGAIYITSGHRHRAYNAAIGGASQSIHIYDYPGRPQDAVAADIVCATGTPAQWAAFLETLNPGGLCAYPASGFVHVDNRQRIGWPKARWNA